MYQVPLYRNAAWIHALLCVALAVLAGIRGIPPQDASAYLTAGLMASKSPLLIYPDLSAGEPLYSAPFQEHFCALMRNSQYACDNVIVPFVSPPPMLTISRLFALLPAYWGLFAFQLLSSIAIAFASLVVFLKVTKNSPAISRPLVVTFFILLPFSVNVIEQGQTSAWLCALVAAGFAFDHKRRGAQFATSGLLTLSAAAKLTPLAFLLIFGAYRKWRLMYQTMLFAALLTVVTACTLPLELFSSHFNLLPLVSKYFSEYPFNISLLSAWKFFFDERAVSDSTISALILSVVLISLWVVWIRKAPFQDMWLLCWLGWLVASPISWWHYNWIGVIALAGIMGARVSSEKIFWLFPLWCSVLSVGLPLLLEQAPLANVVACIFTIGCFASGLIMVLLFPLPSTPTDAK